jgi:hypothetical protein
MNRWRLWLVVLTILGVAWVPAAARVIYVTTDAPADPDGPPVYLPWQVIEHDHLSAVPYTLELTVPGNPAIAALEKLDAAGAWLIAVETPNDLAGALPVAAEPRDLVRVTPGGTSLAFQGSCVGPVPIPADAGIDGVCTEGGDNGNLVVSFDVPTTIGGPTFQPSELVRYLRTGPPPCGWMLAGSVIDFALVGTWVPPSTNVCGVDRQGGLWVLALDVPADVAPPLGPTATPGTIVATDGATWNQVWDVMQTEGVPGWSVANVVEGLACQANPGRIESPTAQILLDKSLPQVIIQCPASCASGAEAYGLYEGTIASVSAGTYDHVQVSCLETCPSNIAHLPPPAASTYYLVVPFNSEEEGSYGTDSAGFERPQAALPAARCKAAQNLTPCP